MNIEEVILILDKSDISHYLEEMSQIHMYTKHYMLIAEELSEEGVTFLQPLKEHRDAYDHLMRVFSVSLKECNTEANVEQYILENVKKAFGHEYRAFFDMADWLTFICRKYIREELSYNSKKKKYAAKYDFSSTREFINDLPYMIAKFREAKDVSNQKSILDEVLLYKQTMDRLLNIYQQVQTL